MKKIWLTVAASLFVALTVINAQESNDTTGAQSSEQSTQYRTDQESGTQSETGTINGKSGTQGQYDQDQSYNWRDEDRMSIGKEELPSGLVETLKSDEYQGWENATIYRNKTSEDYMLVMQENGQVKTFYFDQEGKSKTTTDSQIQGNAGDQESSDEQGNSGTPDGSQSSSEGTSGTPSSSSTTSSEESTTPRSGPTDQSSVAGQPSSEIQITQPSQQSNAWLAEDRIIILSDDIPTSLRLTLEDEKYLGWENSSLYRNRKTNEYMIEIRDGSNAKVYYFDKDGKVIDNDGQ
jgi:hypothetical protein